MYLSSWRLCVLLLLSWCCDPLLRLSHPSRHDSALADGWGKERARLDDQNTLKDDHNKVTCTPPALLGGLLSHVRVSHGRRGGVGLYPGRVLHGFSLPVQGLQAPYIVLEHLLGPPGVSHGLPWRPGVTLSGVQGARSPQLWTLLQRISLSGSLLVRNSRVTSNEKRSWNYCFWQMGKLHTTGTYVEGLQVPALMLSRGRTSLIEASNISFLLLCVTCMPDHYLGL